MCRNSMFKLLSTCNLLLQRGQLLIFLLDIRIKLGEFTLSSGNELFNYLWSLSKVVQATGLLLFSQLGQCVQNTLLFAVRLLPRVNWVAFLNDIRHVLTKLLILFLVECILGLRLLQSLLKNISQLTILLRWGSLRLWILQFGLRLL